MNQHSVEISRERPGLGHRNTAAFIKKAAAMALEAEGITQPCLISVMLTDEEGIRTVNREFRGIDRETDVLSFPLNELVPGAFNPEACERDPGTGELMLGDMMLSLPACERQGEEFGHGFEREVMYLTVHSVLHLLGYDHMDEGEQKRQMRAREEAILPGRQG
ncbi:MAG: rRNA maturation RNase YbeY [Oscillospiraceae bacterium]|nr:rRNA maturation RNase YbeY [Oscillospiraceae bacterium]